MDFTTDLVRGLLKQQSVVRDPVTIEGPNTDGTDNAIFFVDRTYAARLPRHDGVVAQVLKEQEWLPTLRGRFDLAVPSILFRGMPTPEFPRPWTLTTYLPGEADTNLGRIGTQETALALARFVNQLHAVPVTQVLEPGDHNFGRGSDLRLRGQLTSDRAREVSEFFDPQELVERWGSLLGDYDQPPASRTWIHGDLQPGNLLFTEGRLSGVIDFGGMATGDPAADLVPGWNTFSGDTRQSFRYAVAHDDATWSRAQAWAFSIAVLELSFHKDNPHYVQRCRRVIEEILQDR